MTKINSKFLKGANKMKKILLLLVAFSLVFSTFASAQIRFKDVPDDHWAADAVYDLVKRGITDGFPDGTFRGNEKLTRFQTAQFLYKMARSIESRVGDKGLSEAEVEKIVEKALAKRSVPGEGAQVSGTVFIRYLKGLTNTSFVNNFDLNRAYVTIKSKLGDNADAKVVLDSQRSTGMLDTFLKYAYVDLKNTIPADLIPGVTVNTRIGAQPTYWSSWVDKILGLRVVASSMVGLDGGVTTTDIGLGVLGKGSIEGMPAVNYLLTALNGSSVYATETNSGKTIAGRVDSEVYPGVTVALGGQVADLESDGDYGGRLANALVAYKADQGAAYAEAMYGQGALGYSVAGIYNLGAMDGALNAYNVFGRVDIYDPNRNTDNDGRTRLYAGMTYDWNENVMLVVDYDSVTYGSASTISPDTTMDMIALRTQINL
jgi:hypothetical protein